MPLDINYGKTLDNGNFDNATVYFGPENPTEKDTYYNNSYMFRNNDQFNICYDFFIDYNTMELKYKVRYFQRSYSAQNIEINTVPKVTIRQQELGDVQICSKQILPYTFFKSGQIPYDSYSNSYLQAYISNRELQFNGISNKNKKGGIL